MSESTHDYVVVGGGSAGCVVAAELAATPGASVLVLERGPRAEQHPETLHADGYKDAFANDAVMLERFSVPQPHAADQRVFMGTGSVTGGSGSVNGMVYTRGQRADYDEWPRGWQWPDIEPDFQALERALRPHRRAPTAFTEAAIAAAEEVGFRRSEDLNDGALAGVLGYEWMSYEGDRRRSSYVAFVRERDVGAGLRLEAGALARRILVREGRAVGVEWSSGAALHRAWARREVVLAAGALETPKLLMLSGIGPGDALRRHGIAPLVEAPEIGQHLLDHPNVPLFFLGRDPVDCHYPQLYGFDRVNPALPLAEGQADTCYVFYPARSSLKEAAKRILPGKVLPARHYNELNRRRVRGLLEAVYATGLVDPLIERLWGIVVILGKPRSRGTLTLASAEPDLPARLDPAYFSHPDDRATMLAGVRRALEIAGASPLAAWGNLRLAPGPTTRSDPALQGWIAANAITTYHFGGTCRMGDEDRAPCDPRLRLRGVRGLRIADASAIPSTPVSALNAPSMLIGYRAARYLREEHTDPAPSASPGA